MSDNLLDPLRHAHEEEYFLRHNQALVKKLREKMAAEAAVHDIEEVSQVHDQALLEQLAQLGVTRETVPVLHLMPVLEVAWADGEIQEEERVMLLAAADESNLEGKAREAFEAMLTTRPSQTYFDAALSFIRAVLEAMPADKAARARENITNLSESIALSAGGWFGIFARVDANEKSALNHITERLSGKAGEVMGKL